MLRILLVILLITAAASLLLFFSRQKGQDYFFESSNIDFPNPERGFYTAVNLFEPASLNRAAAKGFRLGHAMVLLTEFKDRAISSEFLRQLETGLEQIQNNKLKIILRFSYGDTIDSQDAKLETVLEHLEQLKPLLEKYKAVIAVQQAGFIGAWGEWHNSSNNLLDKKTEILEKLLNVVPKDRMVAIRNPSDLIDFYPKVLTKSQAFSNSFQARTAFHNDCLLSNRHDSGTYYPQENFKKLRNYVKALSTFVATGGETCNSTPSEQRTDCPSSLKELKELHWDYLNNDYYKAALDRWQSEGCFDEISKRLGYRLEIIKLHSVSKIKQGKTFELKIKLKNSGFGKVYNPRNIELILENTASAERTWFKPKHLKDSRKLLPLAAETKTISFRIKTSELKQGSYKIYLNLSDPLIPSNPAYSIRLANKGVWQETSGYNDLGLTIDIE